MRDKILSINPLLPGRWCPISKLHSNISSSTSSAMPSKLKKFLFGKTREKQHSEQNLKEYGYPGDHNYNFKTEWADFKTGLHGAMEGPYPVVDNGAGKKATMYQDVNLRYDREKACQSNGHPHGEFMNYSVQANYGADNSYLRNLANGHNGPNKVRPGRLTYFQAPLLEVRPWRASTCNKTRGGCHRKGSHMPWGTPRNTQNPSGLLIGRAI